MNAFDVILPNTSGQINGVVVLVWSSHGGQSNDSHSHACFCSDVHVQPAKKNITIERVARLATSTAISLAHLFLINALLGLKVEDYQDGNGHHQGHNVGPPARGGNLQCSGHGSLQFQSFWHCRPCRAASQGGSGCRLTTEHEGRSAKHHKGQCHQEGRKQHKPWSHGCSWNLLALQLRSYVMLGPPVLAEETLNKVHVTVIYSPSLELLSLVSLHLGSTLNSSSPLIWPKNGAK